VALPLLRSGYPLSVLCETFIRHAGDEITMRLVGRFDFVGWSGHLGEQHGIVGIIPVDELSGETF